MPPKKRGRKKAKDPSHGQRLDFLITDFESKLKMGLLDMQEDLENGCSEIAELYDQALSSINPNYLDLTLDQIQEIPLKTPQRKAMSRISAIQSKLKNNHDSVTSSVNRQLTRSCLNQTMNQTMNRTFALNTSIQKSAMNTKMKRAILSSVQQNITPLQRKNKTPGSRITAAKLQMKRKALASNVVTPVQAKKFAAGGSPTSRGTMSKNNNKLIITPKFDPRTPMSSKYLRKPKRGEVIMSMSGSPLHNTIPQMPEKPSLLLSFGDGRVVDVTDKAQLMSLKTSCITEETKSHLLLAQRTLAGILQPK